LINFFNVYILTKKANKIKHFFSSVKSLLGFLAGDDKLGNFKRLRYKRFCLNLFFIGFNEAFKKKRYPQLITAEIRKFRN
jgi:hypothetical protein